MFEAQLSGAAELQAALQRLDRRAGRGVMRAAARAGAVEMARAVRRAAPRQQRPRAPSSLGAEFPLARSVRVQAGRSRDPSVARASVKMAPQGIWTSRGFKHHRAGPVAGDRWAEQAVERSGEAAVERALGRMAERLGL